MRIPPVTSPAERLLPEFLDRAGELRQMNGGVLQARRYRCIGGVIRRRAGDRRRVISHLRQRTARGLVPPIVTRRPRQQGGTGDRMVGVVETPGEYDDVVTVQPEGDDRCRITDT